MAKGCSASAKPGTAFCSAHSPTGVRVAYRRTSKTAGVERARALDSADKFRGSSLLSEKKKHSSVEKLEKSLKKPDKKSSDSSKKDAKE